jgi:uncharacterized protein YndB with AHSA1/START domain
MPTFRKQSVVSAPPEKVFAYVADFSRHGEWTAHRVVIQPSSGGPVGQGSVFTSRNHFMGRELEDRLVVTEFAPNQRLVYEADGSTGVFRHIIAVEAADGGSRITKSIETLRLPLTAKLMLPLLMVVAPRALAGDLERIKSRVQ